MPRTKSFSESEGMRRQSSPVLSQRRQDIHPHHVLSRQATVSFPIEHRVNNKEHASMGIFDKRCCKCKAICPPPETSHNLSDNLLCFYAEHSDETYHCRFWMEFTADSPTSKLEVFSSRKPDKFLMSIYMKDPYPRGMYCVKCFQRYAGLMQKNEANSVCRYYDIHRQEPVFQVENT